MNNNYRNIPKHDHSHSLYVRCNECHTFGIPMDTNFTEAAECGNCGSMNTVKYYPSCCIMADRRKSFNIRDIMAMTMFGIVLGFYIGIWCINNI